MKNSNFKVQYAVMCFALVLFFSCNHNQREVNVLAAHEMNPPIADSVYLQRIQNDNEHILLLAKYPKGKIEGQYLAMNHNSQKIVLHDDGELGDAKANDLLFTATIPYSVSDATRFIQQQAAIARSLPKENLVRFGPRGMVITEWKNQPIFVEDFTRFRPHPIPVVPRPVTEILKTNSLMITKVAVVEDPTRTWNFCSQTGNYNGAWSFNTIMRQLATTDPAHPATDAEVSRFVLNWLNSFEVIQIINGESVEQRRFVVESIINPWIEKSKATVTNAGDLDMHFAPFKLTAIVNRLDLRGNSGFGTANAGEARLVFCAIMTDNLGNCELPSEPLLFNVIFEYGIPKNNFTDLQAYANQWYNLKDLAIGSPTYNAALEQITNQFTLCGTNPAKPHQNSINQIRTNEAAVAGTWEEREFHLNGTTHNIVQVPVTNEPAEVYNSKEDNATVQRLARLINSHEDDIASNTFTVPLLFESVPVQGAKGRIGNDDGIIFPSGTPNTTTKTPHHWDGGPVGTASFIRNSNSRQQFSLNTCSGCHSGETQTTFLQISPAAFAHEADLSGFLIGKRNEDHDNPATPDVVEGSMDEDGDDNNKIFTAPDPAGRNSDVQLRQFNDLERRALHLEELVHCTGLCALVQQLTFNPIRMVH